MPYNPPRKKTVLYFSSLSELQSLVPDEDAIYFVNENDSFYICRNGFTDMANGTTVIETLHGGNYRYLAIGGKYNYFIADSSSVKVPIVNITGAVIPKYTPVKLVDTLTNGVAYVEPLTTPIDFAYCITIEDVAANGSSTGLVLGMLTDITIPTVEDARVFVGKKLYISIDGTSPKYITDLQETNYSEIGYITNVNTISHTISAFFVCSQQINEQRYKKIEVADCSYEKLGSGTTYADFSIKELTHLKARLGYIYDYYDSFSNILFWDFVQESTKKKLIGLRFATLDDLLTFLRTAGFDDDASLKIQVYILQQRVADETPVTYGVNMALARLKTGSNYTGKRIGCVFDSLTTFPALDIGLAQNLLNLLKSQFPAITAVDENNLDSYVILWLPRNPYTYFNQLPYTAIGNLFLKGDVTSSRKAWDSATGTMAQCLMDMYIKDMAYVKLTPGQAGTFNAIKSTIMANNGSMLKIYHVVDNITNPRYHAFYLKPCNIDTFLLRLRPELLFNNISTNTVVLIGKPKFHKKKTFAIINNANLNLDMQKNYLGRVDLETLYFNATGFKHIIKGVDSTNNVSNKKFGSTIQFYGCYSNGVLTPPLTAVRYVVKESGIKGVTLPC